MTSVWRTERETDGEGAGDLINIVKEIQGMSKCIKKEKSKRVTYKESVKGRPKKLERLCRRKGILYQGVQMWWEK